jgi:N6-L-threonylcarbamoyladenine synthase
MRFIQKEKLGIYSSREQGESRSTTIDISRHTRTINEICYATQKSIIDVLVKKTLKASEKYNCKNILVGGGVSANNTLIKELKLNAERCTHRPEIFSPEKIYCTDNGAMIGAYALLNPDTKNWKDVSANPDLYFA